MVEQVDGRQFGSVPFASVVRPFGFTLELHAVRATINAAGRMPSHDR
jgi:hypothetical protein